MHDFIACKTVCAIQSVCRNEISTFKVLFTEPYNAFNIII